MSLPMERQGFFNKLEMAMNDISKRLKERREQNRLSTKGIAILVEMSEQEYVAIEEGQADMTVQQLMKLCAFYEIKPDDLLLEKIIVPPAKISKETRKPKKKPAKKTTNKATHNKELYENYLADQGDETDEPGTGAGEKRLLNLIASMMVDVVLKETADLDKLDESPGGYHMEERRQCPICEDWVSGQNSWYDSFGFKCMLCQKAINEGIIPAEIAKDKDLYYSANDLKYRFNMKRKMLNDWIKQGIVKVRRIKENDGKGAHFEVFLLSENAEFLPPPEKLRVAGWVKETNADGKEEFAFYPWYFYVDAIEHLKDYGISRWLKYKELPQEEDNKSDEPKSE